MTDRNYIIGTGYYHAENQEEWAHWFFQLWIHNTDVRREYEKIIVIANGGCRPPHDFANSARITLNGNLGHVGQLLSGEKKHRLCGWSGAILTCAMVAYCEEADLVFKEQDVLTFGPCIEKMYEEIGDAGMIFGSCKLMPAAQSLFLIKHDFIPDFVRRYIGKQSENTDATLPEKKFWRMEKESPDTIKRFSFPFDRDRPLDMTLPVWYSQKNTKAELLEMRERGLVSFDDIPDVKVFTNDTTNCQQ